MPDASGGLVRQQSYLLRVQTSFRKQFGKNAPRIHHFHLFRASKYLRSGYFCLPGDSFKNFGKDFRFAHIISSFNDYLCPRPVNNNKSIIVRVEEILPSTWRTVMLVNFLFFAGHSKLRNTLGAFLFPLKPRKRANKRLSLLLHHTPDDSQYYHHKGNPPLVPIPPAYLGFLLLLPERAIHLLLQAGDFAS